MADREWEVAVLGGVAKRVLSPAASPLHMFGAELRRLREEANRTQEDLGRAALASMDLVRRVETAERYPSWDFARRCDEELQCYGYLLRMWPLVSRQRTLLTRDGSKEGASFAGGLCDRPVLDWLISETHSAVVKGGDADHGVDQELSRLRQLDHTHGAGFYYPAVSAALPRVQETSPLTAIGFFELAGYEAVDLGADGSAQQHYLAALSAAVRVGERLHGGYLIAVSLAHLSLHCGDPAQAARLALAALQGTAGVSTPATRAAFLAVLARARARSGDEAGTTAAFLKAERELDRSRSGEEPAFISYFGQADLADERAHAFFDLGIFRLSQHEASSAISTVGTSRVRRLAIDSALLASALACDGKVDEACAVGRQAVDFAASTVSFRSLHRVMEMLGHLQPMMALREVRDLFEYAHLALPATAPWLVSRS